MIVKIESLNEFSKEISERVKSIDNKDKEIIKIKTDKKYLLTSSSLKFILKKGFLLRKTFLGFACEIKLFIENLNKIKIFKNLIPELVEKKDPPIITKIKNINDKFLGVSSKEIPKFDTLLDIETSIFKKLLSKLKKTKIIEIIIIK